MPHTSNNNLNKRGCAFSLVLNDSGADLFKSSRNVFTILNTDEKIIVFLAVMYHAMDYIDDEGRYKTPHYHVVIVFQSNYRVDTILNWVSDLFKCNKNQISIEKCNSVSSQVRYLIHLDDLDKYQYKEVDIISNNDSYVHNCMMMIPLIHSVEDLFVIMRQYPNIEDLIKVIGLDNYKKYRCVIQDVKRERYY